MDNGVSLVHWNAARRELALAHSINEVKQIRDQAEAIREYIRVQGGSFAMQNQAAEIKLRAERKLGEMLKGMELPAGARGLGINQFTEVELRDVTPPPKLEELGINKMQSYRWQLEAEIPEEKFEQFISETVAAAEELTSVAAVRIAQKIKREAETENAPPLPSGIYNVIYADPPWKYDNSIESWGPASLHYNCLPIETISYFQDPQGVRIQEKFAPDSVLFLWVTNPFVRDAFEVVDAWGFEYKTNIVWVKTGLQRPGSGFYVRGRHELLFICTKGSFVPDQTGKEPIGSVLEAPVREHSHKPVEVYTMIETLYPEGHGLELFAREKHSDYWTVWGEEIKTATP